MRKWLSILLLTLISLTMYGQGDSPRLSYAVKGIVKDAESGKAIPTVHVSIPGRNFATVTNADGEFILKSDAPIKLIEFSCLGYRKKTVKASDYVKVSLQREVYPINESSVVGGDPVAIVRAALEKAGRTYCPRPEMLECFYRETVQKRSRYTYVAEAVAHIYKDLYTLHKDAAALEKSRLLMSQRRSDTLCVKTQGGPNMVLRCDFLSNREILFTDEEMALYQFRLLPTAYIGDRLQLVVSMTPAYEAPYALYFVTMYIDLEKLTFTRIEASMDMRNRHKAIQAILVSKPMGLRFFPEEVSIVYNYRTSGGVTRPEYFRSTMRFACDWRKRLFKTKYTAVNELVVTDILPEAHPIPRSERFGAKSYLNDEAAHFADPDFWSGYNIIEPSESLEHATIIPRKRRQ